jgi:NADPH:quinone reductase-like Zn-dependent oxidoreductase
LINGATSVTGQMAVQLVKYYGASKIIVTGRNMVILEELRAMGADEIISLKQDDPSLLKSIKEQHARNPISIVIDYLWGHPMEVILAALKGTGINHVPSKSRIVSVGSVAGPDINLPSDIIRSSDIEILGSGIGSFSADELKKYGTEVLPALFGMAAERKLKIQTETADLKDIETAWQKAVPPGKRLVIKI